MSKEQKRDAYKKDADKKYGNRTQLENEKSKLLKEKGQIEDAAGVTAAREREQHWKRSEAIRQRQERERYNVERKAERLVSPSKNRNAPNL